MTDIVSRKLIVESPNYDLEFIIEQTNRDAPERMYAKGEYIMMNNRNKNRRRYLEEDMIPAANTFISEYVNKSRGVGELNHSAKPEIDLDRIAHRIVALERDKQRPDYYTGKSMLLDTPNGRVLQTLTKDGVRWGLSTKCLGQISESSEGNDVKSPMIISVDAVFDPSVSTAMAYVDGILENKSYIIGNDGNICEACGDLERRMAKYPGKHQDAIRQHILESLQTFLKSI